MARMEREKKRRHSDNTDSSSEDTAMSDTDTSSLSSDSTSQEDRKREKHKSKSRKSSKTKSRRVSSSSDKKQRTKHKEKRKKSKHTKRDKISEDDYFIKSSEFRSWLSNERGTYFSDLSSHQSRRLFKKFVRKWNSGQLKKKYYDGIQSSSLEHSTQTQYKWKFSGREDEVKMGLIRDQVSSWTSGKQTEDKVRSKQGPSLPQPVALTTLDPHEKEEQREVERKITQQSRKEFRKYHEMVLDELLPKATGHEARIEKRRAKNQQRREKETSPDLTDSSLMGPRHSIEDKIRSRQDQREKRAQVASQKISDYQEKERSKVAAILEMAKANKKEGAMW